MNERFASASLIARVHLAHEPAFDLADVHVCPSLLQITRGGASQTLEPRVMQVLVALARGSGQVISREDLLEACWDGRIVGEDALERCIGRLRKLSDWSGRAFAVETIPRVGYRLNVATASDAVPAVPAPAISDPEACTTVARSPAHKMQFLRARAIWLAALGILLVASGLVTWRLWPRADLASGPVGSLAVLPFANLSGDPAKDYLSDGISEELIDRLSNNPDLRVASRAATFALKGKHWDTKAIAGALHVRAIVEGSVRESGNRIRIAVRLIDPADGYNLWSASFDQSLADILSLEDEVAARVTTALTHKLVRTPASARKKIDPAVYRLYLQARKEHSRVSSEGELKAFALLKQVTARQPDFADGFASLSSVAFSLAGEDPAHDPYALEAGSAAQTALALDPHNLLARAIRATLEMVNWNWDGVASDLRVLRAENPDKLQILAALRAWHVQLGFPDQAMAVSRRIVGLYPSADRERIITVELLNIERRFSEALPLTRDVLARQPGQPWALAALCQQYAGTGRMVDARNTAKRLRRADPDSAPGNANDACTLSMDIASGDKPAARRILARWAADFPDRFTEARMLGDYYVELNDFDRASDWYERAYDRHESEFFRATFTAAGTKYRTVSARWKALTQQPYFRAWQKEHDRIAAELRAGKNPM